MTNFKLNVQGSLINNILKVTIDGLIFNDDEGEPIPPIPEVPETGIIGVNYQVTSSTDDGNVAENVKDDDFNTRWSANGEGQYLTLDLPSLHTVDSVQLAIYNGNIRKQYFQIQYSTDGLLFSDIQSFETSGLTLGYESFSFTPVNARHLRIVGNGNSINSWNSITEVRVNNPEVVEEVTPPEPEEPEEVDLEITPILTKDNWNDIATGNLTKAKFNKMFADTAALKSNNTAQVVDHDGYRCLGHFYGKDTFGQKCGMQEYRNLPLGLKEVWHGLHFKFQDGFVTPWFGKFWGATCGKFGEGGGFASGGQGPGSKMLAADKGGCARLNYYVPGFDPDFPNHLLPTKLKHYNYHHDMTGINGSDMGEGAFGNIIMGQWHQIVLRQVMNTENESDGITQVWLDGVLVSSTDKIRYTRPEITAQTFGYITIGTFSGGGDSRWNSVKDQWMYQRDMYIWHTNNPIGNQLFKSSDVIPTPMGNIGGQ